jgi:hypothetical protein
MNFNALYCFIKVESKGEREGETTEEESIRRGK